MVDPFTLKLRSILVGASLALLAGCATAGPSPEDAAADATQARWQAAADRYERALDRCLAAPRPPTASNPATGERLAWVGGRWVPFAGAPPPAPGCDAVTLDALDAAMRRADREAGLAEAAANRAAAREEAAADRRAGAGMLSPRAPVVCRTTDTTTYPTTVCQ